jgi:hypothetical protein
MTHSPPVPPGNQSPYPLQEPPHEHHAAPMADRSVARAPANDQSVVSGRTLGIGVAIGLGSAALLAAWFYGRADRDEPAPRKAAPRRRTPAPKRTSRTAKARAAPARRRKSSSGDDKKERGPRDASRIALGEDYEVAYWTRKFSISRDRLEEAVAAAGNGAEAVAQYLGKEST